MSETKDRLTLAATTHIQRGGPQAASFRALGEALGIRSASVHYHFGSKEALLHEVAVRYTARFDAQLATLVGPARLLDLVGLFEDVAQQGLVCLCGMLAAQPEVLSEETRDHLVDWFDRLEGWIRQALHDAELDIDASVVLAALEGALLLDRLDVRQSRLGAVRRWLEGA